MLPDANASKMIMMAKILTSTILKASNDGIKNRIVCPCVLELCATDGIRAT